MQLTTKSRYAVTAMVDIALQCSINQQKPVSLSDIAVRQNITIAYLEQIFSKLKKSGLVKSVRGPGGGYVLGRAPIGITVIDVIDAVDESIKIKGCATTEAGKSCVNHNAKCLTHDLWEGLGNNIKNFLSSVNLQDVVEGKIPNVVCHSGDKGLMNLEAIEPGNIKKGNVIDTVVIPLKNGIQ